ncbi:MAG: pyridoxal-phosphate dependent enzyme, partial [Chloroflexota bacterium]|nr:pyridoxal-phosphate dependent enzyme [Chloroflexota bacterium]
MTDRSDEAMKEPPDPGGSVASTIGSFLTDLECTACTARFGADEPLGVCPACGKVLFARYDLHGLRRAMPTPDFSGRPWDLWRYRELLPIREQRHAVSLGEGATPLIPLPQRALMAAGLPAAEVLLKDEGANPTGSFKARGLSVAVARAAELGVEHVALPSAGNAGAAA